MNDSVSNQGADARLARDRLVRDLRNTVESTEELLRVTAGQVGERIAEVRAKAQVSLEQARAQLTRLQAEAVERGKQASMQVDEYVSSNPWKAIGVVGLVGLIIGALIARR